MDESVVKHLEQPAKLDGPAVLLLKAAEWIERHGWVQGQMSVGVHACALGALSNAAGVADTLVIIKAEERLKRALPYPYNEDRHAGPLCAVAAWNDECGRTADEVVAKLRAVALGG